MFISLQGHVTVRPEDDEDMWHLYNLIQEVSQRVYFYLDPSDYSREMQFGPLLFGELYRIRCFGGMFD